MVGHLIFGRIEAPGSTHDMDGTSRQAVTMRPSCPLGSDPYCMDQTHVRWFYAESCFFGSLHFFVISIFCMFVWFCLKMFEDSFSVTSWLVSFDSSTHLHHGLLFTMFCYGCNCCTLRNGEVVPYEKGDQMLPAASCVDTKMLWSLEAVPLSLGAAHELNVLLGSYMIPRCDYMCIYI